MCRKKGSVHIESRDISEEPGPGRARLFADAGRPGEHGKGLIGKTAACTCQMRIGPLHKG
jgi:hypothetical protein